MGQKGGRRGDGRELRVRERRKGIGDGARGK